MVTAAPRETSARVRLKDSNEIHEAWEKIAKIERVDEESFEVRLRYQGGTSVAVSLRALFAHPKGLCAEILRGGMFRQCFVEGGALAWPNGFELCPDALYQMGTEQKRTTNAA